MSRHKIRGQEEDLGITESPPTPSITQGRSRTHCGVARGLELGIEMPRTNKR